jgi:hypothetical protein
MVLTFNCSHSKDAPENIPQELAFPAYLHAASATAASNSSGVVPSDFGSSLHTYHSSATLLEPPPPLQTHHRDFASTDFSGNASLKAAPVSTSVPSESSLRVQGFSASQTHTDASSSLPPTSRHQPALSRFIGTPQRTFSLSSNPAPVFSDAFASANTQSSAAAVSRTFASASQPSLTNDSLSSVNSSFHASSTNSTPNSLFKSPSQIPLAPNIEQLAYRPPSADSAASRFVSSLSETHLQAMLSDLLVEKNALAKVLARSHHVIPFFC